MVTDGVEYVESFGYQFKLETVGNKKVGSFVRVATRVPKKVAKLEESSDDEALDNFAT